MMSWAAFSCPRDGQTNPTTRRMALAKGARIARRQDVREYRGHRRSCTKNGRAIGVATAEGEVTAENGGHRPGMWARRRRAVMAGVDIPLQAAEHFYIVTEPPPDLPREPAGAARSPTVAPITRRTPASCCSARSSRTPSPGASNGIPQDFDFDELPEDFEHFEPILEAAIQRVCRRWAKSGIRTFFNGPESFTPDVPLSPGRDAGAEAASSSPRASTRSASSPPAARARRWRNGSSAAIRPSICGTSTSAAWRRFQTNKRYLHERVSEALGLLYAMHWPYRQYETARGVRTSRRSTSGSLRHGACFGETAGWERANWFAPPGVKPEYGYSYGTQNWFAYSAAEHVRRANAVGLFDMSFLRQIPRRGPRCRSRAATHLRRSSGVAPGRIVYTQWLNERGGIEADLTVTRLGRVPCRSGRRGCAVAISLAEAPCAGRCALHRRPISPRASGAGGDGSEFARPARGRSPDADLSNASLPFGGSGGNRARLRSGRAHTASLMSASSAGRFTCPANSRAMCSTRFSRLPVAWPQARRPARAG